MEGLVDGVPVGDEDERRGDRAKTRGMGKNSDDNRANQLNPNNDAYWQSRGEDERPDDWEDDSPQKGSKDRPPPKK